jgi:hypothetical protein
MPFKSQAQRGFMFAKHPEMAKEWEKETPANANLPEHVKKMAEGGVVESDEEKDPSIIPEDIKDFVQKAHKEQQESRPDEKWRIVPAKKEDTIAPYKRDDKGMEESSIVDSLKGLDLPHFDEGGLVSPFDVDAGASDTVKMNGIVPPPPPQVPDQPPIAPPAAAPIVPRGTMAPEAPMAPKPPVAAPPALTDQDFMDKANKMLGLNPQEQAGFMKMLGDRSQKGQIGAAVAGIGDAIASGGTLGKVNPGALNKSEELIQNKEKQGIEGMQTIRGNQEKTLEVADKLEARDPQSPLSKWAQKAYGPVGKKIGLNLDNASAALIGDVTGKGVDALNTEYQNQLKMMGLDLQKKQVEATIGNQKAERDIAREGHQAEAAKTLADRGIFKTLVNAIPGTAGHAATKVLEKQAQGLPVTEGPVKVNSMEEYKALPSGTHYVDSYGKEKVKK